MAPLRKTHVTPLWFTLSLVMPVRQSRRRFLIAVLVSAIAVWGQHTTTVASSPADILYAQPGQLVDVGGFRLNLYCTGSGSPTVVFDSGYEDWAPAWFNGAAKNRKVDARLQL
jgi:hypothetical protein